jgi:hypothetical protein
VVSGDVKLDREVASFDWPEKLFYYLNEELANLNRNFLRSVESASEAVDYHQQQTPIDIEQFERVFLRLFNLLKACLILSRFLQHVFTYHLLLYSDKI